MAYGPTTWDSSKYDRMSSPRNAAPWGVYSPAGQLCDTYCTLKRAEERAKELSAKWGRDHYVARAR